MTGRSYDFKLDLLLGIFVGLCCCSSAYKFYAGGRDGWVLSPSESYSHWAGRNRFQVNDTIVFKYKKGEDSVLVVNKEDYDKCNTSHPIEKLDVGDSEFKFDRSGPFFFVSGAPGRCEKGQKLVVVVLAVRNKKAASPASSPPALPPLAPSGSTPGSGSPTEGSPPSSAPSFSSRLSVSGALVAMLVVAVVGFFLN